MCPRFNEYRLEGWDADMTKTFKKRIKKFTIYTIYLCFKPKIFFIAA